MKNESPNRLSTASVLVARLDAARRRVFYGWWVILALLGLLSYGSGAFFHGFSVFFKPISAEFGWSRAVTAGAFALSRLEGGLGGPFLIDFGFEPQAAANLAAYAALVSIPARFGCGYLSDRLDKRAMLMAVMLSHGLGVFLLSLATSEGVIYLALTLLGIGDGSVPLSGEDQGPGQNRGPDLRHP